MSFAWLQAKRRLSPRLDAPPSAGVGLGSPESLSPLTQIKERLALRFKITLDPIAIGATS
ncbi:MAG TPA: hypothetical protein VHD15_06860 [Hyphomicrobiales bacterium]|nr:hypothetical protein [Hyphomicrobiales bacterium]